MNIISKSSDALALHITKEEFEHCIKNSASETRALLKIVAEAGFHGRPLELSLFEGADGSIEIFAKRKGTVTVIGCTEMKKARVFLAMLAFSGACLKCSLFYKKGKYYILPLSNDLDFSSIELQKAKESVTKEFLTTECLCLCSENAHIVCSAFCAKRKEKP